MKIQSLAAVGILFWGSLATAGGPPVVQTAAQCSDPVPCAVPTHCARRCCQSNCSPLRLPALSNNTTTFYPIVESVPVLRSQAVGSMELFAATSVPFQLGRTDVSSLNQLAAKLSPQSNNCGTLEQRVRKMEADMQAMNSKMDLLRKSVENVIMTLNKGQK